MTTRGLLLRRSLAVFALFIAACLGLLMAHLQGDMADDAFFGVLLVLFASQIWIWRTPCLSCGKALGWKAVYWSTSPWYLIWPQPCPHCGVNIGHEISR
jgi:hypothetical protein